MKNKSAPSPELPVAYRRLRDQLSQVGWIALGSVLERSQPGQGGPCYQWSRRVGQKTVTVALSAEPFAWLPEAIANQRKVWAQRPTPPPPRRNPSPSNLTLSSVQAPPQSS